MTFADRREEEARLFAVDGARPPDWDADEERLPPLWEEVVVEAERLFPPLFDDEVLFCVEAMGEILLFYR